jgi:hypothetical protein
MTAEPIDNTARNGADGTPEKEPTVIRLPKDVTSNPRHDAVMALLTTNVLPLWESAHHSIATVPVNPTLAQELRQALAFGQATQGLEAIVETLAREQKGLNALTKKGAGQTQAARISRILFITSDGSTRFCHDCDSLLSRYETRMAGLRLAATGEELGNAIFGESRLVRAILVHDKRVVARTLLALVPGAV